MWLITTFGNFSVVEAQTEEHRGDMCVRARVKADLKRLRKEYFPSLGPTIRTPTRDYLFRAFGSREGLAVAMIFIAYDIRYPNFKDAAGKRLGYEREAVLHKVWTALRALQAPVSPSWRNAFDADLYAQWPLEDLEQRAQHAHRCFRNQ